MKLLLGQLYGAPEPHSEKQEFGQVARSGKIYRYRADDTTGGVDSWWVWTDEGGIEVMPDSSNDTVFDELDVWIAVEL